MKKEFDYIEAYEKQMKMLQERADAMPNSKPDWERFELTKEMVHAKKSQYKRVKNEARWEQVEKSFYPWLCQIAKLQGGKVTMDLNENTYLGTLVYVGKLMILNNVFCRELYEFADMIRKAADVFISSENNCCKITLLYDLYDEVRIADNTTQIADIQRRIDHHKMEKF